MRFGSLTEDVQPCVFLVPCSHCKGLEPSRVQEFGAPFGVKLDEAIQADGLGADDLDASWLLQPLLSRILTARTVA